jgi:hypothetical protein
MLLKGAVTILLNQKFVTVDQETWVHLVDATHW